MLTNCWYLNTLVSPCVVFGGQLENEAAGACEPSFYKVLVSRDPISSKMIGRQLFGGKLRCWV